MPFSTSSMEASNIACLSILEGPGYYLPPADSTICNSYLDIPDNPELDYAIESILSQDVYLQECVSVTCNKSALPMSAGSTPNHCTNDTIWLPKSPSPSPSVRDDNPARFSPTPDYKAASSSSLSDATHGSTYKFLDPAPLGPRRGDRRRVKRTASDSSTYSDDADSSHKRRIPHHQVERKYRKNLNAELERLRCAVPTLAQGHARLSKSMILAGAVQYIEMLEQDRRGCTCESRNRGRR